MAERGLKPRPATPSSDAISLVPGLALWAAATPCLKMSQASCPLAPGSTSSRPSPEASSPDSPPHKLLFLLGGGGQDGYEAQPGGVGLQCKHHHVNIYLCLEPGLPASHALPIQVHVARSEALVTESQAKGTNVASWPSPATNSMCGSEQELPGPSFSHL